MRHRKKTIKLGRTSPHRDMLLSSLVCHLIERRRIKTTLPKARAARVLAEKMVTLGKDGSLAAKRRAVSKLREIEKVNKLFTEIAPSFNEREGGYTRIIKLGKRSSDSSEMVLLEWVEGPVEKKTRKKPAAAKAKAAVPKAEKAAEAVPAEETSEPAAEQSAGDHVKAS